jgi:hypothetical protein
MAKLHTYRVDLLTGDTVFTNGVHLKIVNTTGQTVDVEIVSPDDFEINPDEHPDAEIAASAADPNAAGRTIGSRLPGGVR